MSLNRRLFGLGALAAIGSGISRVGIAADSANSSPTAALPVAILLDQGATVIDFAGPWEAFQDAEVANVPGFRLFTVAASRAPLRAAAGLQLVPDYSFDDAPDARVIVMGAQGGNSNPAKVAWIRKASEKAEIVLSVCTGAFLLARTGLIDGMSATTHHEFYDQFEHAFPKVRLVRDRRFVDNGKFVTAGGLTSGVDAALHVVAHFYGEPAARAVATYMEHDGNGWVSGVRDHLPNRA
jgi:transcriptional regulator GlxA family with amidase domain